MLLELRPHTLHVSRGTGDMKRYKNESHFLYHVKKELRRRGNDCIKKLAHKDGHLVDDNMHYIRESKTGAYMVFDNEHALRNVAAEFNKHGFVVLTIQGEGLK